MIYFHFLCLYQSSGKRVKIGRNCYDRVTVAKFLGATSSYKRKSFISHFRLSRLHILPRWDLFNIGQMPLRFQNLKESLHHEISINYIGELLIYFVTRYLQKFILYRKMIFHPSFYRERVQRLDTLSRRFSTHQPGITTRNASSFRYHWAQLTSVGRRST